MREYKNIFNLSEALADDPEAWRNPQSGAFPPPDHFAYWGEPLFGYYRSDDAWVVRRHLQMLADAQVDYLVLDTTNREVFKPQAQLLMEQIIELQAEGVDAPRVVFMTRSNSTEHMDQIYEAFYAPDAPLRYPSTWFQWDGKPLIMGANPSEAVADFFTFRFTQWPNQEQVEDGWDWMSFDRPQRGNYRADGRLEQMAVSTAQNSGDSTAFSNTAWYEVDDPPSRSSAFHEGTEPTDPETADGAVLEGANFAEEWEHAIREDPETIMVTGWNEWIAGNWASSPDGPMLFYDVVDQRWNRDIAPMVGGYEDNYYLQLVDNIRRYKGVNPADNVSDPVSIDLDVGFEQWQDVGPIYRDYTHDTVARNHPGVGATTYVNNSGRNNIVEARVARDQDSVAFYAATDESLTAPDATWMHLYLDLDDDLTNGWAGYDARVIFDSRRHGTLQLRHGDTWRDEQRVDTRISKKELAISIPREALGLSEDPMQVAFKWWDNPGDDIMSAYTTGDAAPEGRFSYLYDTGEHMTGAQPQAPDVEPLPEPEAGRYRIEDTDPTTDFEPAAGNGRWVEQADKASSEGSYTQLHNPAGEYETFWRTFVRAGFRGDSVSWITPRGPQGTEAEIFVDGLSQGIVDLYAPHWSPQETVFTVNGLPDGYHEVMVVYAQEAGTYYHDAFDVGVQDSVRGRPGPPLEAGLTAWATSTGFTPTQFRPTNPAQATDGSLATWWKGTGADSEHLELSLGTRTQIRTVHVAPREDSEATVTRFHIETQNPGGRWHTIGSGTDLDGPTTIDVRPALTDRVRLVIDETEGGPPEIAEFSLDTPEDQDVSGTSWTFTDSTQGWTSNDKVSDPRVGDDGRLTAEFSGTGTLWSPQGLDISADDYSSMSLNVVNDSDAVLAAVVFKSVSDGGETRTGRHEFRLEARADLRPRVVNLADTPEWDGVITQLGIEIVDADGTVSLGHVKLAPDHAVWASHFDDVGQDWEVGGATVEQLSGTIALEPTDSEVRLTARSELGVDLTRADFISVRAVALPKGSTLELGFTTSSTPERQVVTHDVPSADSWQTIQIPMSEVEGWEGTLEGLDLTIRPTEPGQRILLDAVRVEHFNLAPIEVVDAWEFDQNHEGWTVEIGISDFVWNEPGVMTGDVWYEDSRILSQDNLWLDLTGKSKLTIGLQNNSSAETASLYFSTLADGTFDSSKGVIFDIVPHDDQIRSYTIDVGELPTWDGTLRRLRLDPFNDATGTFVLDYIRVE